MRPVHLLALVVLACAQSGETAPPAATAGRAAPTSAARESLVDVPDRFRRVFTGTVGGGDVEIELRREGASLSGHYLGPGELWLTGEIDDDLAFRLEEESEAGPVGHLVGRIREGADGLWRIEGERRAPGGPAEPVDLVEQHAALPGGVALVSRDLEVADSARGWSFYAQVPTWAGDDPGFAVESLVKFATRRIHADLEEFRQFGAEEPDSFARAMIEGGAGSFYESGYHVALAEGGVVALQFGVSTYYVGAAHPNHASWTLVWDLDAAAPIELEDVFADGVDGIGWISERAIAALRHELADDADGAWIADGAGPDPANFESWAPTPEGISITFDPYQVTAYAMGPQWVEIPWSEIAPVLRPAGPLAAVAAARGVRVP